MRPRLLALPSLLALPGLGLRLFGLCLSLRRLRFLGAAVQESGDDAVGGRPRNVVDHECNKEDGEELLEGEHTTERVELLLLCHVEFLAESAESAESARVSPFPLGTNAWPAV